MRRRQIDGDESLAVGLSSSVRIGTLPVSDRDGAAQRRARAPRDCSSLDRDRLAVLVEPGDVGDAGRRLVLAVHEIARAQHRMARGEWRSAARRSRASARPCGAAASFQSIQLSLVVLAIGVVVAALGAAELVAGQQHRRAVGEEHGGEHRALQAARGSSGSPDRRSALRRPSWRNNSRRGRPGCPRRWPRCAARRSSRRRRSVKPSWQAT